METPGHDIGRGCIIERPKVIFNALTGKFVMWFHLELKGHGRKADRSSVAVSDSVNLSGSNPSPRFLRLRVSAP
jgi:hypothetical protein